MSWVVQTGHSVEVCPGVYIRATLTESLLLSVCGGCGWEQETSGRWDGHQEKWEGERPTIQKKDGKEEQ